MHVRSEVSLIMEALPCMNGLRTLKFFEKVTVYFVVQQCWVGLAMVVSRTLKKFQVSDSIQKLIESEPHEKTCHIHLCVYLFAYIKIPSSGRQANGQNRP
jgi:hypothetical protein